MHVPFDVELICSFFLSSYIQLLRKTQASAFSVRKVNALSVQLLLSSDSLIFVNCFFFPLRFFPCYLKITTNDHSRKVSVLYRLF